MINSFEPMGNLPTTSRRLEVCRADDKICQTCGIFGFQKFVERPHRFSPHFHSSKKKLAIWAAAAVAAVGGGCHEVCFFFFGTVVNVGI